MNAFVTQIPFESRPKAFQQAGIDQLVATFQSRNATFLLEAFAVIRFQFQLLDITFPRRTV